MKHHLRSRHVALLLLILSLLLYGLDYLVFGHGTELAAGFVANLAFVPVYVLFVTLMIERLLRERERIAMRQKLNMVIGVFFSEVGTPLLGGCFPFVTNGAELAAFLRFTPQWGEEDFLRADRRLAGFELRVDSRRGDLDLLKSFLDARRGFLLGLLENSNLLEHDEFTDLLWAVFHLMEELEARASLAGLPASDLDHLSGDITRAYGHLVREWLVYLRHLRVDYPYLFSLAVRTNPLDPEARVEVDGGR
jgi:hypothetical protein